MASPQFIARAAGALYVLSVSTAVTGEILAPGKFGIAAVVIPVLCYLGVTLLLYLLFKPVNKNISLLAVCLQVVALALEAFQWQPRGVSVGMVFHGLYCLAIGYLILRSTFLPRILGALMALAGLVWLIYLSPPLANFVSPYNTVVGLVGEASPMLWLLVMGVRLNDGVSKPAQPEEA